MIITHDKNVRLTRKRAALVDAARFYATLLGLGDYDDVEIRICFKHGFIKTACAYAQVMHVSQNLLCIDFDAKINDNMGLFTMAHEMVHCKQFITGELAEDAEGLQLWHGEHISNDVRYYDEPWEIEAMEKENRMAYQYIYFRENGE